MLTSFAPTQVALLFAEILLMAGIFIGLFRLRRVIGLTPFLMTLGALQYLQVVLAMSVYVEVSPGVMVSPGSTVLFVATLFGILLMYIRCGAAEARRLTYGVLAANVILSTLTPLFGLQLLSEHGRNLLDVPAALFFQNPRLLLAGTVALVLDVLLIITLYERVSRRFSRHLLLNILLTLTCVAIVDSLIFTIGAFVGTENFSTILWSGLVGKICAGAVYSLVLYGYLTLTKPAEAAPPEYKDVFHRLTYRRKYELTLALVGKDPLTGLQNRGAFEAAMAMLLAEPGGRLGLLLIDVDHFKAVNDTHGHAVGDHALKTLADTLNRSFRAGSAYRIGGEEFVVVLEGADLPTTLQLAERLRTTLAEDVAVGLYQPLESLTLTIGAASAPTDGTELLALMATCDRRLYAGKRGGRDRVVGSDGERPPAVSGAVGSGSDDRAVLLGV